jgi:uncharacterized membrane protein YdjX (TVP38/TMEM64 family)
MNSQDVEATQDRPRGRRVPWKAVIAAAFIVAAVVLSRSYDVTQRVADAMNWIDAQGVAGGVVFVALYVVATVVAFPASLLTLGAGAVYGLLVGFVLVSLSSTLGATAAFLVARYAARDWVARRIEANPKFRALDDGVAEEGWKIVLLTRLSPAFPFNLQNYGYGLTKIPALHYVVASWVGMIPGTIMYVYLGHAAGSMGLPWSRCNG